MESCCRQNSCVGSPTPRRGARSSKTSSSTTRQSRSPETVIWGDKSPSYLTHIPLLKACVSICEIPPHHPGTRAISACLRRGLGVEGFAHPQAVWERDVASAIRSGRELGSDYEEIVFEELLDEPEAELRRVCSFLQIDFAPTMLTPSVSHEPRGDTGGIRRIVSGNQKKYRSALKPRTTASSRRRLCIRQQPNSGSSSSSLVDTGRLELLSEHACLSTTVWP